MKRRTFIISTAALGALYGISASAQARDMTYVPGLVKKQLDSGKTVFVDFYASWCTTCRAQSRVIDALRAANPEYDKNIVFVTVDWDTYSQGDLARALKIPRRSTLVVLKGNKELGRVVAGTSKKMIKALMDTALKAAMA